MATEENVDFVIKNLMEAHSVNFMKRWSDTKAGISQVLTILHEPAKPITSGDISKAMGISTARTAVLIKKMAAKGLVTKENSQNDARITIVRLTDAGAALCEKMKLDMRKHLSDVIDEIGMDKMNTFVCLVKEIIFAAEKSAPHCNEM